MLMITTLTTACPLNVNYWRCCNTIFWIFDGCQFVRLFLITIPMMMISMMTWDEMRTEKLVYWEKAKPGPATCARFPNEPVYAPELQSSAV